MNPEYAKVYVRKIRDALVFIDPRSEDFYYANARVYTQRLDALAHSIQTQINTVPPQQRNMIVFHNAWLYYNERFGIRTVGVIEINPGQDPNPQQIAQLVDLSKKYHVRAIFSEPEYSPKLAQALAQSAGITIVADLYDDSIGQDPRVRDYISMLQYDTGVIVKSLK
jgi:manganese/iron transport system substrate-binding protein